eukprot:764863-Hanusia_phi.AAC.4
MIIFLESGEVVFDTLVEFFAIDGCRLRSNMFHSAHHYITAVAVDEEFVLLEGGGATHCLA